MMTSRPRKLSVEIAEQLQQNAARTKRAQVVQLIMTRCMSAGCSSRVTVMPKKGMGGWVLLVLQEVKECL